MQNALVVVLGIIAGIILGVLSNWIYDILKSRGFLPDRPSVKHTVVVVFAFIPIVFLVALPSFMPEPNSESEGLNMKNQSFETTKSVFPEFLGFTWTYNVSRVSELFNDESGQYETGQFTRRIAAVETGFNDYVRIIAVDQSGENFLSQCATTLATGDLDIWYVVDNNRFYTACSKNEAYDIAIDLRNEAEKGTTERLLTPDYVIPFEVGNLWTWDPSLPPRDDANYQWHVQAKVDVDVPAGRFEECYRIVLGTLGSTPLCQ